jgi:glucan-binding YG repeat protein
MFKRSNKITALLVAAASVMSIVPAMAADATRLGTKEGTIKQAIAFDGGKYIYDGYRTDDDNSGIYYNGGDKDKPINDLEDYQLQDASKYDTKYAYTEKGNDEYLVDLSSGKVIDDETAEEKKDSAQAKLRTALKKSNRYENTNAWDDVSLTRVLENQFGDVWYKYEANGDATTTTAAANATLSITLPSPARFAYEIEDGNYDITVGGTKYTYTATTPSGAQFTTLPQLQNIVKTDVNNYISKFTGDNAFGTATMSGNNLVATATKTGAISSSVINDLKAKYGTVAATNGTGAIGSTSYKAIGAKYIGFVNNSGKYVDASYTANIYVYSSLRDKFVKVEKYSTATDDNTNTDDKVKVELRDLDVLTQDKDYIYAVATVEVTDTNTATPTPYSAKFLQKISKTQGDKPDGAYIPKTVNSYLFDDKSQLDNGDVDDAYTATFKDDDGYSTVENQYRVKNNTLYVTRTKSDKVKIFKLKMTQIKEKLTGGTDRKYDAYVVKQDGDTDHDIFDGAGAKAVSIDIDGNTWALDKGAIYKYDGSSWKEMFTVDRSIDNLDVYNDGNLIAWENNGDDDGKVYTTVQEGTKKTQDESTAVTPVIKTNWDKNADGTWSFYDQTGTKIVSKWINVGGHWYYLKADGIAATGWQQIDGTWYYFDKLYADMKAGWVNDNGTWYYTNSSGAMVTGWVNVNGSWYYLSPYAGGPQGSMKTGWINDNGTWYYLNGSGAMLANTTVDGYRLGASGAWIR